MPMSGRAAHTEHVSNDSPKTTWAADLPDGPPEREALARLVESDEARDAAENEYFEMANDPQFVATETAQRRFRGQLRRRLRHRAAKARENRSDSPDARSCR